MSLIWVHHIRQVRKKTEIAIATFGLIFVPVAGLRAAVISAKGVKFEEIHSAVSSAHDGDTVEIPAGTASWTQTLELTKSLTLRGANRNAADDATIITDDIPLLGANKPARLIAAILKPAQSLRISGITFRNGSRPSGQEGRPGADSSAITVFDSHGQNAPVKSVRIDHCHFDGLRQEGIRILGWIYGVIDHCQWDTPPNGNVLSVNVSAPTWGGGSNAQGNGSWADNSYFGSEKFVFVEDNVFNNNSNFVTSGCIDCEKGGRYVARHNTFVNTCPMAHGTESGQYRGARVIEVYNNAFTFNRVKLSGDLIRSGSWLVHDNTYTAENHGNHIMSLVVFREIWPFKAMGGANGNNPWDLNVTEADGVTNIPGHNPHQFLSGTHTGPANSDKLIVNDAHWKPDQWVGYSLTNLDRKTKGGGLNYSSYITSNTSDEITFLQFDPNGKATDFMRFNPGNRFQIYRVITAIDQPGRGKGELLGFDARGNYWNTRSSKATWPRSALEPVYCWNNTLNGTLNGGIVGSQYPTLRENRDYYNGNNRFDGTTGVGSGALKERPKSCAPGVAYWATDQGPRGTLYVCSEKDRWAEYYQPYAYPHPLVTGAEFR